MEATEKAIFDKIAEACRGGGYAIVDGEELADAVPDGGRRSADDIETSLKELQRGGFIDIKYARGGTYCVTALKARPQEREESNAAQSAPEPSPTVVEVKEKVNSFAAAMYALAAFFGAAAGSAIVCALFAAV